MASGLIITDDNVSFVSVYSSELNSIPIKNGQTIYTKDTFNIYQDVDGVRTKSSDMIVLDTEQELNDLLAPIEKKIYITMDTEKMWMFVGGVKYCLTPSIEFASSSDIQDLFYDIYSPSNYTIQYSGGTRPTNPNSSDITILDKKGNSYNVLEVSEYDGNGDRSGHIGVTTDNYLFMEFDENDKCVYVTNTDIPATEATEDNYTLEYDEGTDTYTLYNNGIICETTQITVNESNNHKEVYTTEGTIITFDENNNFIGIEYIDGGYGDVVEESEDVTVESEV